MRKSIQVQELAELNQGGEIDLIDVRTPAEFQEVHAVFARNIPLDRLKPAEVMQGMKDPSRPLYVICQSGKRGSQACQKFHAAGYENVINVEGGTKAWEASGLPVTWGKKTMSLERQVRIAAGFLVVLGSALGYFVHPYWISLSAFVGCGLMFAGITDTCGMAMVLARMPWNQSGPVRSCSLK